MRPRCSVFIATSLDGFIARKDGAIDWLSSVESPGEDYGYAAFFATVDTLVVGRKTYDTVLGFPDWPWAGKRVVVLTHRPPAAPRADETFCSEAPAALVERLGEAGSRRVYVDGGVVVQQFLAADQIDDLTLSVLPILLGEGVPLFGPGPERHLELASSRAFPKGLVQLEYRRPR